MARSATSADRSIPHLRDIFWSNSSSPAHAAAPWGHGQGHGSRRQDRHEDVNELAYQFQNDARVTSRPAKGGGKDHFWSKQTAPQGQRADHAIDHGNDSAISVGSTSEDEHQATPQNKKKSKKSRARDNARTLTERDVKHLERHLSMKKTIRKKIMRDLQQAFVEDPTEFRVEDINSHEQLIQSLSFGTPSRHATRGPHAESNFLDMLRANGANGGTTSTPSSCAAAARRGGGYDDQDSGHGSPRGSPTRELSSDRGMAPSSAPQQPPQQQHHQQQHQQQNLDDYEDGGPADGDAAGKKTSFWRRFTMKNKNKR